MFSFKNIDDFVPGRFERLGMLKGKRWYFNSEEMEHGLFKPKRYEFGDRKVFCANHYGEFVGYLLARNSKTPSCKAELAHLTEYYANIHKWRNNGTPEEKDGCIIYNELKSNQHLEHGKIVIDHFACNHPKEYKRLTEYDTKLSYTNNNLEVILKAIEFATRDFYKDRTDISKDYIEKKVLENRKAAITMMVYDCLYGNNDRHDENWAMMKDINGTDISMYPLYDNERVLGLYENQNVIEECLKNNTVKEYSEEKLFSRIRVPGDTNNHSNYKDVLQYLIEHYETETKEAITKSLEANNPNIVKEYLESCENLPACYIEFGTQMYKDRFEVAKEYKENEKKEYKVKEQKEDKKRNNIRIILNYGSENNDEKNNYEEVR